eukprot:1767817-Prymnesium_polylepis.2
MRCAATASGCEGELEAICEHSAGVEQGRGARVSAQGWRACHAGRDDRVGRHLWAGLGEAHEVRTRCGAHLAERARRRRRWHHRRESHRCHRAAPADDEGAIHRGARGIPPVRPDPLEERGVSRCIAQISGRAVGARRWRTDGRVRRGRPGEPTSAPRHVFDRLLGRGRGEKL